MIPLIRLKKELEFNKELTNVVDVLKGIAAARFHVLQKQLVLFQHFFKTVERFLTLMDETQVAHPFVQPRNNVTGVIMVTSDAGFLGGLNSQVIAKGLQASASRGLLTIIGERGANYLRDLHLQYAAFPGIEDAARLKRALAIKDHVLRQVRQGSCGKLVVVYPRPVSMTQQQITVETLLPCTAWAPRGNVATPRDTLWESRPADVIEYLVDQWIGHRLAEIFALSRLSELAARVTHLEGSYQELQTRGKKLRLQYFRARHEIIDRGIREIFAAQILARHRAEGAPADAVGATHERAG